MELLKHEELQKMTPAGQQKAWANFHKGARLENFNDELSELQKFSIEFLPLAQRESFLLKRVGVELSNGKEDYRITVELKKDPKRQIGLSEAIDNGDPNPHRQWRSFSELEDHFRITGTFVHIERIFFQRFEPHYMMLLKDVKGLTVTGKTILVTVDVTDIVSLLKLEYVKRTPILKGVKSPYDHQERYDNLPKSYSALKVTLR